MHKFSKTLEEVTGLDSVSVRCSLARRSVSLSESCVVSEMILSSTQMKTFPFNLSQIAISWVLLLRSLLNRKKLLEVNLKKTSFYVDVVKLVRVVCKCWKIGKCCCKRKRFGLCIKICFGGVMSPRW